MQVTDLTGTVSDYLKCPICMDLPKNKVFQCKSGHTLCEACHSQLTKCPQCRVRLGAFPIRNLVVEQMLEELSWDCPYKGSGCNQKLDRRSLQNHVQSCVYNIADPAPATISSSSFDINLKDENGDTELHRAVARNDENEVKELILGLGADINIKNKKLQTPLHMAANVCSGASVEEKDGYLRIITFLIEKGTDVFAKDEQNMNFLHNLLGNFTILDPPVQYVPLSPSQFHEMVEFLTDRNYKEIFDTSGWDDGGTPLQWAVQNVEVAEETLTLLHVYGVNFNAVNNYGDTVLGYAEAGKKSLEFISILKKFGAQ